LTCHKCRSKCRRFGKHRNGLQRYQCVQCLTTLTAPKSNDLDGMYLPFDKAVQVLTLLTEGLSVSSVERLKQVHHTTILKLLVQIGNKCESFSAERIVGVRVKDVQVDEIWSFIGKKEAHKRPHELYDAGLGDSYCFVAIERSTKLILAWHSGLRTKISTVQFVGKLRKAVNPLHWFQLTADGFCDVTPVSVH
jgi:transposase-like protein